MSINVNDKNLGHATAYAYYKAGGGTMTEAEFTEFMADFGTASQTAVEAAQAALASKNAAQTAATTATNKATEATTAATTATTKAGEASTSASTATSAKDTAVSAASTATTKATEATTAAATATSAKTDAVAANTAAQSAKTAAQTAQTGAETAAASVAGSAAQIATNAEDISQLKSDFNKVNETVGYGEFVQNANDRVSQYYKQFAALDTTKDYVLVVTSSTSAVMTLAAGTADSASSIVDVIAENYSFTANVPVAFEYTPTAPNITFARLWVATSWSMKIYERKSAWNEIETIKDAVEDVEALSLDNKSVLDTAFTKEKNKNLLNENEITKNKCYDSSGNLLDLNGWDTSNRIQVESGKTYYFSLESNGTRDVGAMWYLILFSENNTVLDYNNTGLTSYTPQSDGILHFTWRYSDTKSDFFFGEVSDPNYYDEFGYSYIAKEAESITPHSGVVWACVGDSLTEYNARAKKHYFDYIADELGLSVQNYGVSGTGYAAQKENNSAFFQRILNINEPFDILTIFGSVNDLGVVNNVPLGTYEDTGTDTMGGCINTAIDNFYTIAPLKKLGIISQPPSIGTANNGHLIGTTAQAYNDLLAQICANRSIPFLDMFNASGLRPWDADFRTEFYNEDGLQDTGVHPNSKGQEILSTKIREFIKTLI